MSIKTFTIAALGAAILPSAALAQVASPADYVAKAGASDLYERQSSELVRQTTKDAKVRSFADMMIAQHGKSTADVTAAASKAGVAAGPPSLDAEQSAMIAQLRGASGADRDRTYITQQKAAHAKALTLHRSYAADGTAAPLKAAAATIVPVVEHHIEMLRTM